MRLKCLCGCDQSLTGKQRKFRTDACRKRHNRTKSGQQGVRESLKNETTLTCTVDLGPFADIDLSALHRELTEALTGMIDYQGVWVKRCQAQPGYHGPELNKKERMHMAAAAVLTAIRDQIPDIKIEPARTGS